MQSKNRNLGGFNIKFKSFYDDKLKIDKSKGLYRSEYINIHNSILKAFFGIGLRKNC